MSDNMEHLMEHVADEPEVDALEAISMYAKELIEVRKELKAVEDQAKELKKHVTKFEQDLIPNAMLKVGMTSFEMKTGEKIAIKENLSCSVVDYNRLYEFLEEQGDDSLMRTSIELGKLPQNILNMVMKELKNKYDLDCSHKLNMHPSTLKAYFNRLCGIGGEVEAIVPLSELPEEMVKTFTYYKTTVK